MIFASHNSWSYAKPKKWYMRPLRFLARCQNKDIISQYLEGARMFDLRLYFDKYGRMSVRHGMMAFDVPFNHLMNDLAFLEKKSHEERIYVRVILEQNFEKNDPKKQEQIQWYFRVFCSNLQDHFQHIFFIEGVRKFDWKYIFTFPTSTPPMKDLYSSTTSMFGNKNKWHAKLDDWWPWLYAHLHNKKNIESNLGFNGYLMLDFI